MKLGGDKDPTVMCWMTVPNGPVNIVRVENGNEIQNKETKCSANKSGVLPMDGCTPYYDDNIGDDVMVPVNNCNCK